MVYRVLKVLEELVVLEVLVVLEESLVSERVVDQWVLVVEVVVLLVQVQGGNLGLEGA